MTRRSFLRRSMAAGMAMGAGGHSWLGHAARLGNGHLLAPLPGHHPAKADHLLFIFLTGGFSHLDTFDHKPGLLAWQGKTIPAFGLRPEESKAQPLLPSPFQFQRCGQSGLWISDLFPRLRSHADDLCVIRTMHTDIVEHFQATLAMHTGSSTLPMPSIGAWLSYGLGTRNPNLPSFMVVAEHLPYAGAQVWDANFLPPQHQGVRVVPGDDPIPNLNPPLQDVTQAELQLRLWKDLNDAHRQRRNGDLQLVGRSASFDTARGMMREAPPLFDLSGESGQVLEAYGIQGNDRRSFGWQCLVARRLVEQGVRVVEVIDTGSQDNWDSHGDMESHRPKAKRVDQAIQALLTDLKQRGLLDRTLVAICTEFGRTPWTDSSNGKGRNHFAKAFTCLLAGAGVGGGTAFGETDEFGANIVANPVHVHDYHATILHLMGLDHTRLTYRYGGRDFRLTDVAGNVLHSVLT